MKLKTGLIFVLSILIICFTLISCKKEEAPPTDEGEDEYSGSIAPEGSGSTDKASRDDLAKMHHNLVPFDALSEEDKRKDSAVAIGKK